MEGAGNISLIKDAQNTADTFFNAQSSRGPQTTNAGVSNIFSIKNTRWSDYAQCTVRLTESWSSPYKIFCHDEEICFPLSSDEMLVILKEPLCVACFILQMN